MFAARCIDTVTPDSFEIAEARCFAFDSLPDSLSPATARRVAEHRGKRPTDNLW